MEPASTRMFDIPELVSLITSHLEQPDILRLLLTSHRMYDHSIPSLYKTLWIRFPHIYGILQSVVATLSLSRNIQHIRSLTLFNLETAYFYNCLLEFQEMHARVAGVPLLRPRWLPPPDPRTCQLVALPPLRNLTTLKLDVFEVRGVYAEDCRYTIPSHNDSAAALPQTCYIIQQSPHLVHLNLSNIRIKDHERIRVLTDTIASLKKLSDLQLCISAPKEHWFSVGSAIFFSCPSTLETLSIFIGTFIMNSHSDPDPSVETQSWYLQAKEGDRDDQGNLVAAQRREEPLVRLRQLLLWEMDTSTIRQDIVTILEHCPNIEKFRLPPISRVVSGPDFAGIIAGLCPRVTSLSTLQFPDGSDYELTFRVMEALPTQQLESLSCSNSDFRMDEIAARSIFQRHSATLRHLELAFCGQIQSKAVLTILVECVALEKLELRHYETHGGILILLEDAIEKPWACTKVQRFDLTVGVLELELEPDQEPYYRRESPFALTPAEEQQFAMLEKLYRQVGLLTEVRRLDLRLEWLDDEGFPTQDSAYDTNTFPALLSLGDKRTNRPGYLHLLAGLKKLQKLRGSVFVDVEETEETVDCKEVVWMDENWPELTIAEFFHDEGREARDCFLWLRDQRKHDKIPLVLGYPEADH